MWGHYYGANLGDELVAGVLIDAVRERIPEATVLGFSLDPADTERRHGVPGVPITSRGRNETQHGADSAHPGGRLLAGAWRRLTAVLREIPHLWRSYRALRGVGALLVAGSGQLLDTWQGAWGHPYTIFKWSALAALTGTSVSFLSVGAGPVESRLARWFIRWSVDHARHVSVRDEGSAAVLRDLGVARDLPVVPDMGFALPVPRPPTGDAGSTTEQPEDPERPLRGSVVGVNAMAHASARYWGRGDEDRYHAYLEKMRLVTSALLDQGARVRLYSSQVRADPATLRELRSALGPEHAQDVTICEVEEVEDLVRVVAGCDYVIATRYHSVLLPLLMGVPTIALAYHPKTPHLMEAAGQGAYCLDIDAFTHTDLLRRFADIRSSETVVRDDLARRVPVLTASVHDQFDHLISTFALLGGVSAVRHEEAVFR